MNVLFLTMSSRIDVSQRGIYADLMKKFRDEKHNVFIVCPTERRDRKETAYFTENGVNYLFVKTLNVQKTNVLEKGLGQVSIGYLFKQAIKKYLSHVAFDLILYSTPPITFTSVVNYSKKHNSNSITYLLLKDIFPQNAVDIGMMSTSGMKGFLYKYFRKKEIELYKASDYIGCMSPANVKYLLKHNPYIDSNSVEVAPNSVDLRPDNNPMNDVARKEVLAKYGIPSDKPILLYGGNLGKPQGIPYLIECMEANKNRRDCHFLIVGNGTEFVKLDAWYKASKPSSVTLLSSIPKEDYDQLAKACQIGLIFLDYRFTIPNYPSRLLPYLENKMPIIVCSDPNCDTGLIANKNGYGIWVPSNDVNSFTAAVTSILSMDIALMGEKGYLFLKNNYLVEHTYNQIVKHLK